MVQPFCLKRNVKSVCKTGLLQILIIVAINQVRFSLSSVYFFAEISPGDGFSALTGKRSRLYIVENINLDDLSGEGFRNECISLRVSRS